MIDDKEIEEAQEEIFEDKFLNNGEDVVNFNNGDTEEMYDSGQIKEAISLGAKWAVNEFLEDLWHPASEEPKERDEDIIVLQDDDSNGNPLYVSIVHARHDTFPWNEYCEDNDIYKWCYFKEIAPRKGGNQ